MMRRIIPALLVATALTVQAALAQQTADRPIDLTKSTAHFTVTHIWVEHVTGTIAIRSGSVTLAPGTLIPTSASAVLDPSKISTDEPDRDKSLESADFFDAQKYDTMTFVSTKITPNGTNAFEMDGNLTIHGVTQPERLKVTVGGDALHPLYHASGEIDRHAFGMAVTRLDPTIGGTADITLDIALK